MAKNLDEGLIIVIVIVVLLIAFIPKTYDIEVLDKSWECKLAVEEYHASSDEESKGEWIINHYETVSGHSDEPHLIIPNLSAGFRVNETTESYLITAAIINQKPDNKTVDYTLDYDSWRQLEVGQTATVRVYPNGRVMLILAE